MGTKIVPGDNAGGVTVEVIPGELVLITNDTVMSTIVPLGMTRVANATGAEGAPSADIHEAVSESDGGLAITCAATAVPSAVSDTMDVLLP
jgi:hypothetical protein